MSLSKRVFLVVGTTSAILILTFYFSSRSILLNNYTKIEEDLARKDIKRVLSAIEAESTALTTFLHDWTNWDELYNYVKYEDRSFEKSNFVDDVFLTPRLNFILVYNNAGQVFYAKAFDLEKEIEIPVPTNLLDYIKNHHELMYHKNEKSVIKGLIYLPDSPIMLSSQPILTSESNGPIIGTMLMGRYWNQEPISRLSEITHTPLEVNPLDSQSMPEDYIAIFPTFSEMDPFYIKPENDKILSGFTLIKDINEIPRLLLKIEIPRAIYQQAKATLTYHLIASTIVGFAICALICFLLKHLVINPLEQLAGEVRHINLDSESGTQLKFSSPDELGFLAESINKMLRSLDKSHQELRISIEQIKTLRGIVPICARCKNIKDSEGYWHQVENYIRSHTEAEFSHGLCDKCTQELYPELAEDLLKAEKEENTPKVNQP